MASEETNNWRKRKVAEAFVKIELFETLSTPAPSQDHDYVKSFTNDDFADGTAKTLGKVKISKMSTQQAEHRRNGDTETYLCELCKSKRVSFGDISSLKKHIDECHSGIRYHCSHCSNFFVFVDSLQEHVAKHHSACAQEEVNNNVPDFSHELTIGDETNVSNKNYEGDRVADPANAVTYQTDATEDLELTNRLKELDNTPEAQPVSVVADNVQHHQCGICEQRFATKCVAKKHMQTVHLGISYHCPICLQKFTQYPNLRKHVASKHGEEVLSEEAPMVSSADLFSSQACISESPHNLPSPRKSAKVKCPQCDKRYSTSRGLEKHMGVSHPEVAATFNCSHCYKVFKAESSLEFHTHTCHLCYVCGEVFQRKAQLVKHFQTHSQSPGSAPSGIRPGESYCYICAFCNGTYRTEQDLINHVDSCHQCTQCGDAFVEADDLQRHLLDHLENETFQEI